MKTVEQIAINKASEIYEDRFREEDTPNGYFIMPNYECGLDSEIKEAIQEAFIDGYNMDRWIPVSEADAPEGKYSIFYSKGLTIMLYKDIYGNYFTGNGDIWTDYISHYQPLPSPPKTLTND